MKYPDNPKVFFRANCHGHDIDGKAVNPGDWFGKTLVIEIGCGFSSLFFAVESDAEDSAIDEFTDSEYGHLIRISEEDMDDYDEEEVCRAGNAGDPVDLDHVHIHRIPVKYHAQHLPGSGVTPKEYYEMESNGDLDDEEVWGEPLQIEPNNPSRYVPLKYPVPIDGETLVSQGDIVLTHDGHIHRVIGYWLRDGLGKVPVDDNFLSLELDSSITSCYVRVIKAEQIKRVSSPNDLASWFFSSSMQDTQTILSLYRHGSLSSNHIGKYFWQVGSDGKLRKVEKPFDYQSICKAAGE